MRIGGLQKLTLLDFPGKISCIVFTSGCNLRCPFCHNASLVKQTQPYIPNEEIIAFLKKRKNVLEGVCISGGEPLMYADTQAFIKVIKDMGYAVKLDTNGCFPDRLKSLINQDLIDYVAMDIKNTAAKYFITTDSDIDYSIVRQSADIILSSKIDYEFRTTLVKEFHNFDDINSIAAEFAGAKRFYLQKFADSGTTLKQGLTPFSDQEMQKALDIMTKYIPAAKIR